MKILKYKEFNEKLDIKPANLDKLYIYRYRPKTKEELQSIIKKRVEKEGTECDLNDIDTSKITNMSDLFMDMKDFNGNISQWDVSNVTNMSLMFTKAKSFNGDISKWELRHVKSMDYMFFYSSFDRDISGWYVNFI